ncbi:MAG TPA: cytochrome c, partial [Variovorax sp.]
GDGEVVRRGFPAPPAFGNAALRAVPDDRLRQAILQGSGIMYAFADRVSPQDAWAIVAYLRVLQRDPAASAEPARRATR